MLFMNMNLVILLGSVYFIIHFITKMKEKIIPSLKEGLNLQLHTYKLCQMPYFYLEEMMGFLRLMIFGYLILNRENMKKFYSKEHRYL